MVGENELVEGNEYEVKVAAKGARGEGIGKIGSTIILIKNAKTRIGNIYKVKVTKVYRTFAVAEPNSLNRLFGGSVIEL